MCSIKSVVASSIVLLTVFGFAGLLHAETYSYGNFNAISVVYQQVTENTGSDPGPLFGAPTVSADTLSFSPTSFKAEATGAFGIDLTDSQLATTIQAVANTRIEKLQFSEAGDYTLIGTGTATTNVVVAASLFVRVLEIEGQPIDPVSFTTNLTFSPSDGTYNLVDDAGITKIWTGGVEFDVTAALESEEIGGKATKVYMTLDNTLTAMSENGTYAFIKKKLADGFTLTTVVEGEIPEPSSLVLLVLGALSLFVGRGKPKR